MTRRATLIVATGRASERAKTVRKLVMLLGPNQDLQTWVCPVMKAVRKGGHGALQPAFRVTENVTTMTCFGYRFARFGVAKSPRNLEVGHIIPQSRGGTDHLDNLQLLCGWCNRVKGDRTQEYLVAQLADMGIAA